MKEFMMIYRNAGMGDFQPTEEQKQAIEKQWADWFGSIAAQGKHVDGIRPGNEGKTLRPGNVITDGPYAEVKEILLGVSTIQADSMEEALEIAKGCPILSVGGNVELREVIKMN